MKKSENLPSHETKEASKKRVKKPLSLKRAIAERSKNLIIGGGRKSKMLVSTDSYF